MLQGQNLGPEWTSSIADRNDVILARSRAHERFVGKSLPRGVGRATLRQSGVFATVNMEGENVRTRAKHGARPCVTSTGPPRAASVAMRPRPQQYESGSAYGATSISDGGSGEMLEARHQSDIQVSPARSPGQAILKGGVSAAERRYWTISENSIVVAQRARDADFYAR
jgi:hypothetical protein